MKIMTSFSRNLIRVALLATFAMVASAADVDGFLIDKMCSAKVGKDQKAAAEHTKDCALMGPCQQSGYGVLTADGRYLTFDPAGNTRALEALKATAKKDNLRVRVTGDVKGDSIKVTGLRML
jgi:hypothetical protein